MKKPTVVIAEDDAIIREGCLFATLEPFFEIVAAVDNGEAAVASVEKHKPDIVLLDVSLPLLTGFDAARKILAKRPEIKLLFVSNYSDHAHVEEASRIGAAGYVLKSRAFSELIDAMNRALGGEFYRPAI